MKIEIDLDKYLKENEKPNNKKAVTLYLDYKVLEEVRDIYQNSASHIINQLLIWLVEKQDEINFKKRPQIKKLGGTHREI